MNAAAKINPPLLKYDHMCVAIAEARDVDEVKDIRDKALALAAYVRQSKNIEAEVQLAEIRLRAERKAGQLLSEIEKAKGAREPNTARGSTRYPGDTASTTLADRGISKVQSSKWQKLASIPEDVFEAELAKKDRPATLDGILETAFPRVPRPVSDEALWLWGRLLDFERDGLLVKPREAELELLTERARAGVELLRGARDNPGLRAELEAESWDMGRRT